MQAEARVSEEFGDKSRVMVFLLWWLLWISSRESGIECNSSTFSWILSHFLGKIEKKTGKAGVFIPHYLSEVNITINLFEWIDGTHPLNVSTTFTLLLLYFIPLFFVFTLLLLQFLFFPFTSMRLFHQTTRRKILLDPWWKILYFFGVNLDFNLKNKLLKFCFCLVWP